MNYRRHLPILITAAIALSITIVFYIVSRHHSVNRELSLALSWARQVSVQAESLALDARQRGEGDSLNWAAKLLNQGTEPRLLRVSRMQGDSDDLIVKTNARNEGYRINGVTNVFEFQKMIFPEDSRKNGGIRILIQLDYLGFLGTRSKFSNDLAAFLLFALCWTALYFAYRRWAYGRKRGDSYVRQIVLDWVGKARIVLTALGGHIRNMVKEAQSLTVAAAKSRQSLGDLRERIHGGIRDIREGRQALKENERTATHAEVIALNLAVEAARTGEEGRYLLSMAEELHRMIQKLKKLNEKCEATIAKIEVQLEPWSTDADMAFHSYDDVFRAAQVMDGHIRRTTESILHQAQHIHSLNQDLDGKRANTK
ncbi:hypothetical protein K2X30_11690 [bacterium]|nr:hypothetical protein [bacterium]